MNPSIQQSAIVKATENMQRSLAVIAVAGSGKTTLLEMLAKAIDPKLSLCVLAFGKKIATTLEERIKRPNSTIGTSHSLWFKAFVKVKLNNRWRPTPLDTNKTWHLINNLLSKVESDEFGFWLVKAISLAKNVGLGYLIPNDQDAWTALIDKFDLDRDEKLDISTAIPLAVKLLDASIKQISKLDFDDMLYMPLVHNVSFPTLFDRLFVDEYQDLNPVQLALLKRMLKPNGFCVAVGDPRQSIMAFRGAMADACEQYKETFNAIEMPLSVSFRCSKAVVKEAQNYCSEIEASETAIEGNVRTIGAFNVDTFCNESAILCRNNAPLIKLAFWYIANGRGVKVLGTDIGKDLITLIKKQKPVSIDDLEELLTVYRDREVAKHMSKHREDRAGALADRVNCVFTIIESLGEKDRTIDGLYSAIDALFTDDTNGKLILSSIHKSKGLEYKNAIILDRHLMPSKYARQAWQLEQEQSLACVAITRATNDVVYITSDGRMSTIPVAQAC